MITQIKFVSITVKDQNRALEFYTNKLGFKVATDQPFGEGMRWIELKIPGAETKVVLFTKGPEPGAFSTIVFQTDNVQKTYEELKGRGVEFTQAPKTEPWGTSAMFKDSEGNVFVLERNKQQRAAEAARCVDTRAFSRALCLEVLVDQSGHLEHRDLILPAEDDAKLVIGVDHPLVLLVLEPVGFDVVPDLLGHFAARHRLTANDR
jgi:predicted enzyme related to lactoylglutathione lyase